MTTRLRATRVSSTSPRARSGQWCTVRIASAASKAPSSKGSCVAEAWMAGPVHRLVGAGSRTDVDDRVTRAERAQDGCGDAHIRTAVARITAADQVVERVRAHGVERLTAS